MPPSAADACRGKSTITKVTAAIAIVAVSLFKLHFVCPRFVDLRSILFWIAPTIHLELWRVPDGRRVGAFLKRDRRTFRQFYSKELAVIGRPARCRDFKHTHIVESALRRVEVRVLPKGA